jgi:hypothetical protein
MLFQIIAVKELPITILLTSASLKQQLLRCQNGTVLAGLQLVDQLKKSML